MSRLLPSFLRRGRSIWLLSHPEEEEYQEPQICTTWHEYLTATLIATILSVTTLIMLVFWLMVYRGGFYSMKFQSTSKSQYEMNFHALFMAISILGCSVLGALAFRILCIYPYKVRYFIHIAAFVVALILMIFGYHEMRMILRSQGADAIHISSLVPVTYGLHNSVGCITTVIYFVTIVVALLAYVGLTRFFRGMHRSAGVAAIAHGGLALLSGYAQRQHMFYRKGYIDYTADAYLCNIQQLFVLIVIVLVLIILWRKEFRDLNAAIIPDYAL